MKNNTKYFLMLSIACLVHQITAPMWRASRFAPPTLPIAKTAITTPSTQFPTSQVSRAQIKDALSFEQPAQNQAQQFMSPEEINSLARVQQPEDEFVPQATAEETTIEEIKSFAQVLQELEDIADQRAKQQFDKDLQALSAQPKTVQASSSMFNAMKRPSGRVQQPSITATHADRLPSPQRLDQFRKQRDARISTQPLSIARHIRPRAETLRAAQRVEEELETVQQLEQLTADDPLEGVAFLFQEPTPKPQRRTLPETKESTQLQQALESQSIASNISSTTAPLVAVPVQQHADLRKTTTTTPTFTAQPTMSGTISVREQAIRAVPQRKQTEQPAAIPSMPVLTQSQRLQPQQKEFNQQQTLEVEPLPTPTEFRITQPTTLHPLPAKSQQPTRSQFSTTPTNMNAQPNLQKSTARTIMVEEIEELPAPQRQTQEVEILFSEPAARPTRRSLPETQTQAELPQNMTPAYDILEQRSEEEPHVEIEAIPFTTPQQLDLPDAKNLIEPESSLVLVDQAPALPAVTPQQIALVESTPQPQTSITPATQHAKTATPTMPQQPKVTLPGFTKSDDQSWQPSRSRSFKKHYSSKVPDQDENLPINFESLFQTAPTKSPLLPQKRSQDLSDQPQRNIPLQAAPEAIIDDGNFIDELQDEQDLFENLNDQETTVSSQPFAPEQPSKKIITIAQPRRPIDSGLSTRTYPQTQTAQPLQPQESTPITPASNVVTIGIMIAVGIALAALWLFLI